MTGALMSLVRDGHKYLISQRLCLACFWCDLKVCKFQEGLQFVLTCYTLKVSGAIDCRRDIVRIT